jgi:hypothetical protein
MSNRFLTFKAIGAHGRCVDFDTTAHKHGQMLCQMSQQIKRYGDRMTDYVTERTERS